MDAPSTSSAAQQYPHPQGVLLYYKYVDLSPVREDVAAWIEGLCSGLELVGRVRVANDGLNVTVGGGLPELQRHIQAVKDHPLIRGEDIDFKLAVSEGATCPQASAETGFTGLRVNRCEELVTLGPRAAGIGAGGGGRHASPREFHSMLAAAADPMSGDCAGGPSTVVIDTRNCYETRIGRFSVPGAELLDPMTRQFSDFPAWVDANQDLLHGRRILMYCTGGVRCERASAYVRSKGDGFQDVTQLSGGIQRYLEAFPDCGFFSGKNFVFDERLAVAADSPAPQAGVVGVCMMCRATKTDDYTARLRCRRCRLLLLICPACASEVQQGEGCGRAELPLCELCAAADAAQLTGPTGGLIPVSGESRPLRILCLHGFRQTSRKLQGRMAALRKKLAGLAEFVFVDGPHELPFWYKPQADGAERQAPGGASGIPDDLPTPGLPKRAWLVTPETFESMETRRAAGEDGPGWELAPPSCGAGQHHAETEGWAASWRCLAGFLESAGPFDGIMGFSQGAAVAGYLCLLQHLAQNRLPSEGVGAGYVPNWGEVEELFRRPRFRFAWICSGYPLQLTGGASFDDLGETPIGIPSMHVFGQEGLDGQIGAEESARLSAAFRGRDRREVMHPGGHMIPCSKPFVSQYKAFLQACARQAR